MSKPIKSRKSAQLWIKSHGGGAVKGQVKEGRGKPSNRWCIVNPSLAEIPDGEPWLLKAKNGETLRVLFPKRPTPKDEPAPGENPVENSDAEDEEITLATQIRHLKDMQKVVISVGESLKMVAQLQQEDLARRAAQQAEDAQMDKTNAETLRSMSLHRLAERFLGHFTTYLIAKRQELTAEDQVFLEAVMEAKSKLKAGATIREILANMGLAESGEFKALPERKVG